MRVILLNVAIILLLAGCHFTGNKTDVKPLFIGEHKLEDQSKADEAKKIILSMEEVIEVKGVIEGKNIYIGTNIKHFDRFFLEEIRKNAHEKVKKRYPDVHVHVSTDKKVFMELDQIERDLNDKKISQKEFKERLKKVEQFMKG